jgi:hypothetical protein
VQQREENSFRQENLTRQTLNFLENKQKSVYGKSKKVDNLRFQLGKIKQPNGFSPMKKPLWLTVCEGKVVPQNGTVKLS